MLNVTEYKPKSTPTFVPTFAVEMPALHVIEAGRAKPAEQRRVNSAAAMKFERRSHRSPRAAGVMCDCVEQSLFDRQFLTGAGRHQHDIDDALIDHFANLLAVLS